MIPSTNRQDSCSNTLTKAPTPESPVDAALYSIYEALKYLDVTVDTAESRLRPVMADEATAPSGGEVCSGEPNGQSVIFNSLGGINARIAHATRRIEVLVGRLQI